MIRRRTGGCQRNPVIKNKFHSVTAQLEVPQSGAQGVIVAQGGNMGGWSLYAHTGHETICSTARQH